MAIATRIALYQLLVGVAAAVVWWWSVGGLAAVAALTGGAASAVLTFYSALKTFGRARQDPGAMLTDFFRAQAWKYVIVVLMFVVAIKIFGRQFLPFMSAFMASLSVFWFSLLWKE